jgi:cytochrome c553
MAQRSSSLAVRIVIPVALVFMASAAAMQDPDSVFVRTEAVDGMPAVRVAVADRMVVAACVNCHNSHPASPKRDWKLSHGSGLQATGRVLATDVSVTRPV